MTSKQNWNQEDSVAFEMGFHIISKDENQITLAPARTIFDVPADAPKFVSIFEDRIEIFKGTDDVEEVITEKKPLLMQLKEWAARYTQSRKAPRFLNLTAR